MTDFKYSFDLWPFLDLAIALAAAFVFATLIGAERQYRQRSAGLRTNVLVAIGAAAFAAIGTRIGGQAGAAQIVGYIVSGIGFLGAGVIMKQGNQVWGLNTAATLWGSAAVGACCGVGFIGEALLLTIGVLSANTLLRPLVNAINRSPIDSESMEATYEVHTLTKPEHMGEVRDIVIDALEGADYPLQAIEVLERGDEVVELIATLVSTTVKDEEMDQVVESIQRSKLVFHSGWSAKNSG